ncbi:MAG: hypothetical protein HY784_13755 [Chloroflexi bacterium]|nr:hypothetical protein [Chloroflexota bacterium]
MRFTRKAGDIRHIVSLAFKQYEFPITASELRPARDTCERCHFPEKFSDDSLRQIQRYGTDVNSSPTSVYLVLKTGGGSKRLGLGRGIHWHIENRILYYPTDKEEQHIPYVRVYNDDGTVDEYTDLSEGAGVDPASMPESALKEMDCITCHNRITHLVNTPEASLDIALSRGVIDAGIPEIKAKGVEVLRASYISQGQALNGIAGLEAYYRVYYPDYYAANQGTVRSAVATLQEIYNQSVFLHQRSDWDSHPNNLGHKDTPGCFRCHDGKHLNADQEAVRLECNLCHSVPVMSSAQDFVTEIEISRGPEPQSHLNPNWIAQHHLAFDNATCANCHSTANPGGTDNSSFCSNSACHGSVWTYAGFDAPGLREILVAQLPPPPPPAPPLTYADTIGPLLQARCGGCHGQGGIQGLDVSKYATLMAGSTTGPVIAPGDAENSLLVGKQSGAQPHFGQLTPEELTLVKEWITANAPEK